jgi:hypothetical protein
LFVIIFCFVILFCIFKFCNKNYFSINIDFKEVVREKNIIICYCFNDSTLFANSKALFVIFLINCFLSILFYPIVVIASLFFNCFELFHLIFLLYILQFTRHIKFKYHHWITVKKKKWKWKWKFEYILSPIYRNKLIKGGEISNCNL